MTTISKASIPRVLSYFTGALKAYNGSNIVLNGNNLFVNNTADGGGTTGKCTIRCTCGSRKDIFSKILLEGVFERCYRNIHVLLLSS